MKNKFVWDAEDVVPVPLDEAREAVADLITRLGLQTEPKDPQSSEEEDDGQCGKKRAP